LIYSKTSLHFDFDDSIYEASILGFSGSMISGSLTSGSMTTSVCTPAETFISL
jgi:hypothetical protein